MHSWDIYLNWTFHCGKFRFFGLKWQFRTFEKFFAGPGQPTKHNCFKNISYLKKNEIKWNEYDEKSFKINDLHVRDCRDFEWKKSLREKVVIFYFWREMMHSIFIGSLKFGSRTSETIWNVWWLLFYSKHHNDFIWVCIWLDEFKPFSSRVGWDIAFGARRYGSRRAIVGHIFICYIRFR